MLPLLQVFELLTVPGIGPHIISFLDGDDKAALRAACKTAKAAVDPTITKVYTVESFNPLGWDWDALVAAPWPLKELNLRIMGQLNEKALNTLHSAHWLDTLEVLEVPFIDPAVSRWLIALHLPVLKRFMCHGKAGRLRRSWPIWQQLMGSASWWGQLEYYSMQVHDADVAQLAGAAVPGLREVVLRGSCSPQKLGSLTSASWASRLEHLEFRNAEYNIDLRALSDAPLTALKGFVLQVDMSTYPGGAPIDARSVKLPRGGWMKGLQQLVIKAVIDKESVDFLNKVAFVALEVLHAHKALFYNLGMADGPWLQRLKTLKLDDTLDQPSFWKLADAGPKQKDPYYQFHLEALEELHLSLQSSPAMLVFPKMQHLPAIRKLLVGGVPPFVEMPYTLDKSLVTAFRNWLPQIEELTLFLENVVLDGMEALVATKFQRLKSLAIDGMGFRSHKVGAAFASAPWLGKLEKLEIRNLHNMDLGAMENICAADFSNLKVLKLDGLPPVVFPFLAQMKLPSIHTLSFGRPHELTCKYLRWLAKNAPWWQSLRVLNFAECGNSKGKGSFYRKYCKHVRCIGGEVAVVDPAGFNAPLGMGAEEGDSDNDDDENSNDDSEEGDYSDSDSD